MTAEKIKNIVDQRVALETRLQNEKGTLSEKAARSYDDAYAALQRQLAGVFREADDDGQRITLMLELMRILENRLVYLHNYTVDATSDNRTLAQLVTRFIDDLGGSRSPALTPLEATYYRAVAALYAGDVEKAADGFRDACASEESDEANDIKYKSYVILGNLSHERKDYEAAKEMAEKSLRYSQNSNVTAQALALKALNLYALGDHQEALRLFEESLELFSPDQPFFNSYFYRNALLFCGAIYFDRREWDRAEEFYRKVIASVEPASYDYFDALIHVGRIRYQREDFRGAAESFEKAVQTQKFSENESIIDTYFWLARCHMKMNDGATAKTYLEKVVASDVRYEKKPQAVELLQKVS